MRRVAFITGTRAEYGLLRTVIRACEAHAVLSTHVIATGAHLLPPALTIEEVERECERVSRIEMQTPGESGRLNDARAVGRGVLGIANALDQLKPDIVLVLGDRIEALAGALAASVGGIACAHMHGGDRAEGVADEAMRHAITKLAHIHLPATAQSAVRIERMGEPVSRITTVGSPAIDGLDAIEPLADTDIDALFMLHPIGMSDADERGRAERALEALDGLRVRCMMPNSDPGRDGIVRAIEASGFPTASHLARPGFLALLKWLASSGGVLVGNSSAGLIECAAIGLGVVDLGDRQAGRERCENVVHSDGSSADEIRAAIDAARELSGRVFDHPYGNGTSGERVAGVLASVDLAGPALLRKRNAY